MADKPNGNSLSDLINVVFKATKYVNAAKYVVATLSLVVVAVIAVRFGLTTSVAVIVGFLLLGVTLFFVSVAAVTKDRNQIHSFFKWLAMGYGVGYLITFLLFIGCVFFDLPKPLSLLFAALDPEKKPSAYSNENAKKWASLMTLTAGDDDSCTYPMMFSNEDFGQEVKGESAVVSATLIPLTQDSGTVITPLRAPMEIKKGWGFVLPLQLEGITKEATVAVNNKFKVKIRTYKNALKHYNAESTCGGEIRPYEATEAVLLQTDKPYYEKTVYFPAADLYTLQPNEIITFDIEFKIRDLGVYEISVDIPYTYRGKRGVATYKAKPFVAPASYDLWTYTFDNSDTTKYPLEKLSTSRWGGKGYIVKPSKLAEEENRRLGI